MNVKNYNFTEIFSQDFAEKLLFLRCFWKLKICGAGCCLYHLPAKLKSISIWPLFRSNVCIKFARWVNSSYTNKDHGLSESKLVKISLLLHRPFDLYINWPIKTFFFFCLVSLGRMLRYGPMQLSICPRSASCWTECPGRCCCSWRPMTCWGALKPPYRPEPPPHPSSTCLAAAYAPWPGQKDCTLSVIVSFRSNFIRQIF